MKDEGRRTKDERRITNIVLIGFMASGKTVVGRALAKKLKKKYVSLDSLIVRRTHQSIPKIFRERGQAYFRELESKALVSLKGRENMVLATGGAIVLKEKNVKTLRRLGTVVLLECKPEVALKRSGKFKTRPLLHIADKAERLKVIKRILRARKEIYEAAADITVETTKLSVSGVVKKICQKLK